MYGTIMTIFTVTHYVVYKNVSHIFIMVSANVDHFQEFFHFCIQTGNAEKGVIKSNTSPQMCWEI